MKDFQIREVLRRTELSKYINDHDSKVVEEMKIPVAGARIDLAVINGAFHGYEIKGASDTLQRLPNQLIAYSYVFDFLTIITEEKYYQKINEIIPNWVGISICCEKNGGTIVERKSPNLNADKRNFYIAKLLWRNELLQILTEQAIPFNRKNRNWLLCETLSENLQTNILSDIVRQKLKERKSWRD